jgi:hypothetical protein
LLDALQIAHDSFLIKSGFTKFTKFKKNITTPDYI